MDFDPKFWTWDLRQWQAAGKHAASFAAGGVAVAAALHFISPSDATALADSFNDVYDGAMQVAKGIAGIVAVLTPIYTALKAAHNASATSNIKHVEDIAKNPAQPQATEAKAALTTATNSLPEVAGVIMKPTTEGVALSNSIPSMTVAPAGTEDAVKIAAPPLG